MTTETTTVKETCAGCGELKSLTKGMIRKHTIKKVPCPGGGLLSVEQGGTVPAGDVHCKVCGEPAQLTDNGRVRTHLADPEDPNEGNCPGGSDFPAEHYPDMAAHAASLATEADPFGEALLDGRTACDHADSFGWEPPADQGEGHTHTFVWADDANGHSGSFCACGLEEPSPHAHQFSWSTTRNASVCVVNGCDVTDDAKQKAERFRDGQEPTPPPARMGKPSDDVRRAAERSRTTAAPQKTSADDAAVAAFLNGSGPKQDSNAPGPWFYASFDSTCDTCDGGMFEGDLIRADGRGGYECAAHDTDQEGEPTEPAPDPLRDDLEDPVITAQSQVLTEQAKAPRAPAPVSDDDAVAAFLLAGQGKADDESERYGRWGQYKINHPDTGKQELWQRATTAAKIMANTFTLNQWHQRMTAKGMAMRDDLVLRVSMLDVKADRTTLNELCEEAQVTAGSKISAELGTALHAVTERIDMGQKVTVPPKFQPLVSLYSETVRKSGLKIVPGMLEKTTALTQYKVAGTFDRIFQLPNGEYIIGDLKTGSSLSYGELEIEIQLAIYAHGVNTHGLWDWDTKTWWDPGFKVRPDLGVVMHMPAESVLEGEPRCTLQWVNLKSGWANLALSKQVEAEQKRKNRFRPFTVADVGPYSGNVDVKPVESTTSEPDQDPAADQRAEKAPARMRARFKTGGNMVDLMDTIRARFDACTTKAEASAVFKEVQGQLPPAAEKMVVDETLARLSAPAPVHLDADLSGDGKRPAPAEPRCQECDTDTHSCPGCGEAVEHGTVTCAECSFRVRFEEVETKAEAQKLWEEARKALPKDKLTPMVADALERLKAKLGAAPSGVKDAPPAPPKEPTWAERFAAATTKAEAKAVWLEAKGTLPKNELDPLVKATLARLS